MAPIKSIEKAIDVLSCFNINAQYLTVNEIARQTGLNQSTVSRILSTLAKKKCIERLEANGKYSIGNKFYQWASILRQKETLANLAKPVMEQLRDICGEEVTLFVISDDFKVTCIEAINSIHSLARVTPVGMTYPLNGGAAGRILLADLPDSERRKILYGKHWERFTTATITDPVQMERALEKVRKDNHAISLGEWEEGCFSLSAPVRDRNGKVIASLAASGPIFRLSKEKRLKTLADVKAAALEISTIVGKSLD